MDVDDTLKRGKPEYKKRSLMELVTNAAATPPPAEAAAAPQPADEADYAPPPKKSDPLPKPGERYRPYAAFLNRLSSDPEFIHFVHNGFTYDGYSYHDLRRVRLVPSKVPGEGPLLVLRFIEAVVTEVTIAGRNLDDLYYYIYEKMMPWVWEQPQGFKAADDRATVITSINFNELEK
jgi:hypothetical protein